MGTRPREKPERLAEKLLRIRTGLELSQTEMLNRLGAEGKLAYNRISEFESGKREPSLLLILQYARVAGVHVEALIDDELELPERLPGPVKYGAIARSYAPRSRGKKK
ncbi:MAG TPA: helix-turn-helix transcriptional regulator [Pyrinomonadaceae bacterium]|nr:helix-turn-helix transcriptional regulator [Pyrinomonadaceae bacterium]